MSHREMEKTQGELVVGQFDPRAAAYVASAVHAQGDDLRQVAELVRDRGEARVLDLGCGGGHVSFTVAPYVAEVTAVDLSPSMLAAVTAEAVRRDLRTITVRQAAAEKLPFPDASFDFVLCRYSAHHWRDLAPGLREARRVLAPRGRAVFIDVVSPGDGVLDSYLQTVEMLRDPSHVRNYGVAEWWRATEAAGFRPGPVTTRRLRLDFTSWVARMATPDLHVAAIRSLQQKMAAPVQHHFAIETDGSFTVDTMVLEAQPD